MSSGNKDCDMCDRIKPGDDKYDSMTNVVAKQGCSKENEDLGVCLKNSHMSWKICSKFTDLLAVCVQNNKSKYSGS